MTEPAHANPLDTGVRLGRYLPSPGDAGPFEIACHDAALRRHDDCPWLRAHVARQLGMAPWRGCRDRDAPSPGDPARVPDWALARHALVVGASGGGKSRLCECLLAQVLRRGQSCVALDPKLETLARLAARAREAGVPPDRITAVSPQAGAVPGWNQFLEGLPPAQAAADLVALVQRSASSWGPRLGDLLANAAVVAAAHRLSVYEMVQLLTREGYAQALLGSPPPGQPSAAYREAADFFTGEFLAWRPAARADALSPVTNKIRELLRNDFLSGLLCARENTLRLADLWRGQRVVLVHLDRAALGEEGARLLGGLFATALFRTALRSPGDTPVTLLLDELATAERLAGETLAEIVTVARSYNLRLLAACQHLAALGAPLRSALLGNTAIQAFFRLGPEDARLVAASLAAGAEACVTRVEAGLAGVDRRTGRPVPATWRHVVRDASGVPQRAAPGDWERLRRDGLFGVGGPLAGLRGAGRLYVRAADTGQPIELRRYVEGLAPEEYWLDGPAPLALVVAFPRPRLTGVRRTTEADAARAWTRALQDMPVQHAALRVAGAAPAIIRVADVPERPPAGGDWERVLAARRQRPAEVEAAAQWRRERVEAAVAGAKPPGGSVGKRRIFGAGRDAPPAGGLADGWGGLADDGSVI